MRLPTGFGSVSKNGKNRRKPYQVRVTIGWDENNKQIKKLIGYANSRNEGLQMLAEYHGNPYNLNYKDLTFSYIWEHNVLPKLEKQVETEEMSESNLKGLSGAYKNYCTELYNDKILDIKLRKLQDVVDKSELSRPGKGYIKTVCVKIFDCAIDEYELPLRNNIASKIDKGGDEKSDKHFPFNEEEINYMWDNVYNDIIKINLILCYTGLRPNELFKTKKEKIFLNEDHFITGSKTKAGRDRIIPIHPRIKPLIEYFYNKDSDLPFTTIINKFSYGKFTRLFDKMVLESNMINTEHTPYNGRHTFATRMKQANANEYILKKILGHSIQDLTEKVYTHREIQDLLNEVKKII